MSHRHIQKWLQFSPFRKKRILNPLGIMLCCYIKVVEREIAFQTGGPLVKGPWVCKSGKRLKTAPTWFISVEPCGEVQQLLLLRAEMLVAAFIRGISRMRRLRARRVRIGDRRRRDPALQHGRHGVVLVQQLLKRSDILHRRAQRLHFAHLLVRRSVGHMLAQRLEAHVHLLDAVSFALVASGHRHGLLLRDGIAESVEGQSPLAPEQLWAARALSLQHFTIPVLLRLRYEGLRKSLVKHILSHLRRSDDSCLHIAGNK